METQEQRWERLSKTGGWIAVDLDGTLAHYEGWTGTGEIGQPIPKMVERVQRWIAMGVTVKIFTARVADATISDLIKIDTWVRKHIGWSLPIVNLKDNKMIEIWDDRAIQVIRNTGERADGRA